MARLHAAMMAVTGALVASSACVLALEACGDDTSGTAPDSGNDVTGDVTEDVTMETGGGDTGPDAPGDVNMTMDAGDASDSPIFKPDVEAGEAGPPLSYLFAQAEARALCIAWFNCCPGGFDSGAYSLDNCVLNLATYGWEGTLPQNLNVYNRPYVTVDQTKATACLNAIQAFPCGTQTAAQWATITQACELVLTGTIPVGQSGCVSSWECAPNSYCDPTNDGGTCTALATQGQPCNTVINAGSPPLNPEPDQMCSYLGSQQPALFCDMINNSFDAATCQPLLATGAPCINAAGTYYDDQACPVNGPSCGTANTCGSPQSAPYFFCGLYPADAGGGG